MITVDARCTMLSCIRTNDHKQTIYRMVGHCTNCGTGNVLVLLSGGHERPTSYLPKCPTCGCHGYSGGIHPDRLATEDEVPAT